MGADAGQLFYGAELKEADYEKLRKVFFTEVADESPYAWDEKDENSILMLDEPYETEEYYLLVRETNRESQNGGGFIGKTIETKPEWAALLANCLVDNNIVAEGQLKHDAIGWFLVGHSV